MKLIGCEFLKLKRYNILWIGIVAVIFSTVISVLQKGDNSRTLSYNDFFNSVIWNNFSISFPFSITLIGGYMIDHEYTDDTLKNIMTVPVSIRRLLFAKLSCIGIISVFLGLFSFICTLAAAKFFLSCSGMELLVIGVSCVQISLIALFNCIAVSPLIVFFRRKREGFYTGVGLAFFYGLCGIFAAGRHLTDVYPVTAGLGIIGYAQGAYNRITGCISLASMILITAILIYYTPGYDKIMSSVLKDSTKRRKTKKDSRTISKKMIQSLI